MPSEAEKERARIRSRLWYSDNKERASASRKLRYAENKEPILVSNRKSNSRPEAKQRAQERSATPKYKETKALCSQKYLSDPVNHANRLASAALYRAKPETKARRREWDKQRKAEDPQYRITCNLRCRLKQAIKGNYKNGSAVQDLGCSVVDFKTYLESMFQEGMTWENWGRGFGFWNIDHIMPLSAFDLTNRQHVILSCHYLNMQPLWFEDNMLKRAKIS